jgi:Zn-dependent alcohol dehydrogenase
MPLVLGHEGAGGDDQAQWSVCDFADVNQAVDDRDAGAVLKSILRMLH